jgi:hypothetical protein
MDVGVGRVVVAALEVGHLPSPSPPRVLARARALRPGCPSVGHGRDAGVLVGRTPTGPSQLDRQSQLSGAPS